MDKEKFLDKGYPAHPGLSSCSLIWFKSIYNFYMITVEGLKQFYSGTNARKERDIMQLDSIPTIARTGGDF